MAPCTISYGSSSAARMPSLRCTTRSARPPGTEQEPTHRETDVGRPVPSTKRHLSFTQVWLLSQIHTFKKKPLQKSYPVSPDILLPASRGLPWSGKDMGFRVRQTRVQVPFQPLISCVTLGESLNPSEPASSSADRG